MSDLTIAELLKIKSLAAEQTRRRALTMTLSSPLLRWRYSAAASDQILIVPQNLRSSDPSFWFEFEHGHFGLASYIADLKGASPFRVDPPSPAWERELHGFSWLRHFGAAEVEEAAMAARRLALEWVGLHRTARGAPFEPAVLARRLMSWVAEATLLLEGADGRAYAAIMTSLGQQLVALKATWRNAPDGAPRLTCLIALTICGLAISGHDGQLQDAVDALVVELKRQILDDGGHISRDPTVLVEIVLDLLPLSQCFQARGKDAPAEIALVIGKALAFLRYVRMGDGMLARFNGVGAASPAALATALGYSGSELSAAASATHSNYARLERGNAVLIADVGGPPPLELSTQAQAGALSFELSSGSRLIFVNGGFPAPAHGDWQSVARSTAAHNTLTLAETSSARLVRHGQLESLVGGLPIRGPDVVTASISEEAGAAVLTCAHDGYAKRYGLLHARRLALSRDGLRLDGIDRLEPPTARNALDAPLPFAIRFHLHPDCRLERGTDQAVRVRPGDGSVWMLSAESAALSIEDGLYFVDSAGPRPSVQIVLRAATTGVAEVRWRFVAEAVG